MDKPILQTSLFIIGILCIISVTGLFSIFLKTSVNENTVLPTYYLRDLSLDEIVDAISQPIQEVQQSIESTPEQEIQQALNDLPSQEVLPVPEQIAETIPEQSLPPIQEPIVSEQIASEPQKEESTLSQETVPVPSENIPQTTPEQIVQLKKERKVEAFDLGDGEFLVMVFDEEALARNEQQIIGNNGLIAVLTEYNGMKGYGFKVTNKPNV